MSNQVVRIATRKSALALWQAEFVKNQLQLAHPGLRVELLGMSTRGDKILDVPLAKVGGKGLFVKELESALLEHRADIAVHSMKDVPMDFPAGLGLAVICEREDPRDALVSNDFNSLEQLPSGALIGTSSLRRQCQLRSWRSDLNVVDLRGNVNTRLQKLDEGQYQAIVLASAGLLRLDMGERIRQSIDVEHSLPAGGQGALGIETRADDETIKQLLAPLHHEQTAQCVLAERAMNQHLQGGCQVPIACFAVPDPQDPDNLWLRGLVGSTDGSVILRAEQRASRSKPQELGVAVAKQLLSQGAGEILQEVYS